MKLPVNIAGIHLERKIVGAAVFLAERNNMTPQRTLHGKRHLRAARSVQIGRDKKRIKKFNRGIASLNRAIGIFCSGEWARARRRLLKNKVSKIIITNLFAIGDIAEAQKEEMKGVEECQQ